MRQSEEPTIGPQRYPRPVIPTVASPKNTMGSRPIMVVVKSTVCVEKYATAPWSPSKAVGIDATVSHL